MTSRNAAFIGMTLSDGTPLVRGKRLAAFTNAEEEAVGLTDVVPSLRGSMAEARFTAYREMTDHAGRSQRGNIMLSDFTPVTTLAVRNLQAAKHFYESVLGFASGTDAGEGVFYDAGSSRFFIYESQFAGTNQATAMSFQIPADAFDAEVKTLRAAGVAFDTFDAPGVIWRDGVATMGDIMRAVWFKDPDGNILNIDTDLQ